MKSAGYRKQSSDNSDNEGNTNIMLKLNMQKAAAGLRLSLSKHGINTPPKMELAFNLDVSGSFDDEHRGGLTQGILTRLVPWGMVFDPDQKLDVFTFSNGKANAYHVGDITPATCEDHIASRIIGKVPGYNGGTDYRFVLEKNLMHFGYLPDDSAKPSGGGFLGKLFGKKEVAPIPQKKRALVLHVTDGDNNGDDKVPTREVLLASQKRGDEVYFLFIGCSNQPSTFDYIKGLGDEFPNVGLVVVTDIAEFVGLSDEELNERLIGDELVQWLKK